MDVAKNIAAQNHLSGYLIIRMNHKQTGYRCNLHHIKENIISLIGVVSYILANE